MSDSKPVTRRILLIEDEEISAQVASETLRAHGYEVVWAANGETAMQIARDGRWDLILLDVELPGITGPEIARRFRRGEAGPHASGATIIALTAHETSDVQEQCRVSGMNGYFRKPIDPERVEAVFAGTANLLTPEVRHEEPEGAGLLGGIKPQHRPLLPGVLDSLRELQADVTDALLRNDLDLARRTGHRIKGVGTTFGMALFSGLGSAIEQIAMDGNRAELEEIRGPFEEALQRLEGEIAALDQAGPGGDYD